MQGLRSPVTVFLGQLCGRACRVFGPVKEVWERAPLCSGIAIAASMMSGRMRLPQPVELHRQRVAL